MKLRAFTHVSSRPMRQLVRVSIHYASLGLLVGAFLMPSQATHKPVLKRTTSLRRIMRHHGIPVIARSRILPLSSLRHAGAQDLQTSLGLTTHHARSERVRLCFLSEVWVCRSMGVKVFPQLA